MIEFLISDFPEKMREIIQKIEIEDSGENYELDKDDGDFVYLLAKKSYQVLTIFSLMATYPEYIKIFKTIKKKYVIIRIDSNINPIIKMKYKGILNGENLTEDEKINIISKEFNVDKKYVEMKKKIQLKRAKKTLTI